MRKPALLLFAICSSALAHDAHGHSTAPLEARHLKSPLANPREHLESGKKLYQVSCAICHGDDGKGRTTISRSLPARPTDLSEYLMESMREGEIYWVIANGIDRTMPAFAGSLDETQRWEVVTWVRELRARQKVIEVAPAPGLDEELRARVMSLTLRV